MKEKLLKLLKENWKNIAWKLWDLVDEKIAERVKASESKWDDTAYAAAKLLAEKFLKPEPKK